MKAEINKVADVTRDMIFRVEKLREETMSNNQYNSKELQEYVNSRLAVISSIVLAIHDELLEIIPRLADETELSSYLKELTK